MLIGQTSKFYIQHRPNTQNQLILENYKNYFDVKFLLELLTDVRLGVHNCLKQYNDAHDLK